ncbi:S9 family peptidase [Parapedobacter sp. SGR-10]|uniref:S9 family peptidase n=1 Tax=Parapedobacter sp. SGR-10 TaxID=2710879 RepID=UPI0013D8590B|nr:prolyl oligopeptidase family serine peptidase [Parapedobacter sp. SGR-10]NGF56394.1 S9 family peptidase [Parapedobacter sp. SGR-10]
MHLPSGKVTRIGAGDFPEIHPDSKRVSFRKDDQVWIASLDGSNDPEPLFHVSGQVTAMQWSPDGDRLLFESKYGSYSFIGIFRQDGERIRWIDPSYRRDRFPVWSPDGQSVTFVRALATVGGLIKPPVPWSIMTVNLDTDKVEEIWTSPATERGASPRWPGTFNLRWLQEDVITFLSYQDGWPHLYKINPRTRRVEQLTTGDFTVEQMSYSRDGSRILVAANTGDRPDDIDRKHIGMVDVATGGFELLTKGEGIETSPVFVRGTDRIAFFSSVPHRPTLPALMDVNKPGSQRTVASSLLPDFDYQQLVTPEHVAFKAEDGHPVYGQVFRPKGQVKDAPAIVYIHGGPPRQMLLGWHHSDYYFNDYMLNQYLVSQGYVVLSVNYRLGTGYGFDFQYAKRTGGKNGVEEYRDILAAGKWLAAQPFVDAGRIGVWGGSYGGFLTAMALSKNSDIFKVGVNIHGANYRMLGGAGPTSARADSITAAWTSPVLIIHGSDDFNVRFTESIDLANRLLGKGVEVEYLVFPDDNHHWMLFDNLMKRSKATARFIMEKMPVKH